MGPNIRMPRTCVSLPFMWFARTMTWRMYAWIGLLKQRKNNFVTICTYYDCAGRKNAQPLAVVAWLRRDVERDPPVGTVERDRAHFLQVAEARAGAYGERRGRVGVVELVAQVEAEFLLWCTQKTVRQQRLRSGYLNCHLARKLDGYKVRLGTIRAKEKKERRGRCV